MRLFPLAISFISVLAMGTVAQPRAAQSQTAQLQTAQAQPVPAQTERRRIIRTPLDEPLQLSGRSGGNDTSTCGNINLNQGRTIQVTEPFASLSFEVESKGDYTLLITGENGFRECVFAHNYDGGVIRAPGLLDQGEYQVYVGDRSGERHPYTLSISQ